MDLTSALLLALLVLLLLIITLPRRTESDGDVDVSPGSTTVEDQVASHVAKLDWRGAAAETAERRLLSMGPRVIPSLLAQLAGVDQPPNISVRQQLDIERILADFGPQTFLRTRRFLRRVHRVSPALPALVRVFERVGPGMLLNLARAADEIPFVLLAATVRRLNEHTDEHLLAEALAESVASDTLLIACLPYLRESKTLDALVRDRLGADATYLDDLYARIGITIQKDTVPLPEPIDPAEMVEDPTELIDAFRAAYQDVDGSHDPAPSKEVSEAILALAPYLADPRVKELFFDLAERQLPDAEVGALALRELARASHRSLQPPLTRLLRQPLSQRAIAHLRSATLLCPEPSVQALAQALRSESPHVVLAALEVLCVLDVSKHLQSFLKALGRHRYSSLEADLAAPILARWPELQEQVLEAAASDDREVQLASVELLGCYGDPSIVPRLLESWGTRDYLNDVLLNAVELQGPVATDALESCLGGEPAPVSPHLLARRLTLLRRLKAAD